MKKINVAIIGASGYTGMELIKMLHMHPVFSITYLANTSGDTTLQALHPMFLDVFHTDIEKMAVEDVAERAEVVFLALPHKTSMEIAGKLLDLDLKVVDLSADYRLELETYEKHYTAHCDKAHYKEAVYGLPEIFREALKKTRLVANPGCYPTASVLGLLPFLPYLDEHSAIFIDAKSGVSGAGKGCKPVTHYGHINENIFAYEPASHRHGPEISEKLSIAANGKSFDVFFVPHLLPLMRGMLVSSYIELNTDIDAVSCLKKYYENEPFVRVRDTTVDVKTVAGTNFSDLFVKQMGRRLFISSAVDNLMKGASSAAVVNANLMCGLDEMMGIPLIAYAP